MQANGVKKDTNSNLFEASGRASASVALPGDKSAQVKNKEKQSKESVENDVEKEQMILLAKSMKPKEKEGCSKKGETCKSSDKFSS